MTALLLAAALLGAAGSGTSAPAARSLLALLALIPASDAAVVLVNRIITNQFAPKALPGLELRDGVPPSLRTLVVVPTLLTTRAEIEEQIERLEVHHLASPEGDLRFALLSDWTDAATESVPGDDELLAAARAGIAALESAPRAGGGRRALPPAPSPAGLERGRGQVDRVGAQARQAARAQPTAARRDRHDLPGRCRSRARRSGRRSLRDHARRRHAAPARRREAAGRQDGAPAEPPAARSPHADASSRATPCCSRASRRRCRWAARGRSSSASSRVPAASIRTRSPSPTSTRTSSGRAPTPARASTTSTSSRPRSPGASRRARSSATTCSRASSRGAGLVSDIEVVEEFPARYDVAAARQHRWARGDWQLLPWIFGRGRDSSGDPERRAIPWIGRWKMLDNLRRSLSAPAAFAALVAGWTLPLASPGAWSAFVLATLAMPAFLPFFARPRAAAPRDLEAQPPARASARISRSPCGRSRSWRSSWRTRRG